MKEFEIKHERIKTLLDEQGLDALLLQRVSSFAWATCGAASYVNTASTVGEASLLITPAERYLITNNIEATRLEHEEKLKEQGWEFRIAPWHEKNDEIKRLTDGYKVGADLPPFSADLSAELARMRSHLTDEEGERFRTLGCLCAEAMNAAAHSLHRGETEYEIAGHLAAESEKRGVQVVVNFIATDERIFKYRHPLPTEKTLDRYAMLVLCGRKYGLVCSITRFVHFGSLPDEIQKKAEAVARVDAAMLSATRPGKTLGEIFQTAVDTYAEVGYPDEWQLHHQGGSAGYEPREVVASPGATDLVHAGQVYAWNPSITGTKSEDTVIVNEGDNEVLTTIEGWPMLGIEVNGREVKRPAILEIT